MLPTPNPLLGTGFHAVGAGCAALCYSPQQRLHRWSWQTYWIAQAAVCWFLLPILVAALTVPDLLAVLREAPSGAMWESYLLGVLYGVGGIAFGIGIRYVGYSLTYAIAIGVSCVLGTLLPAAIAGTLLSTLSNSAGLYVVSGVLLGGSAMVVTGIAGFRKEREIGSGDAKSAFNAKRGIPIVLLAGVLSAVFSFSLQAAAPVAEIAARHGAGDFQSNVIYLFSNTGAFTTSLIYAGILSFKAHSWGEFAGTADGRNLVRNYALSVVTGVLWYFQFFFYGLGHVRMGRFDFSSWAIHMIILILLSCGFGIAIGEWRKCMPRTKFMVGASIGLLVGAVGLITLGNYLAAHATAA